MLVKNVYLGGNIENMKKKLESDLIPAIPPEDYKGSHGDWHIALIERDLWDGEG